MNKLIDTIKSKKVKTPIGVLPYDWKVEKLGKFIKIYSGESPSKIKFKGEGIPYYKVDDLNQFDKYMGKSKLIADSHSIKKTVPKNSLIFPKRGAAILTNKVRILTQESYFDTNIMGVEVKEDEINLEFLYYYIVKRGLYKIADTSTIPQLNNKHIEPLLFPKPELKEQKKISEVLSTWDKAIELKEKLIEQKKQQKKGLMQKLLTGEVRLPGFNDKWIKVEFGKVLKFLKKEPVKNPQDYYLLTVKLHLKGVDATDKKPNVTTNGRPYYLREPNELLIGRQNFHNGGIGIVPEDMKNYVASNAISSVGAIKGNLRFYYYYLSNANLYKRIEHIIGGTGQKEISESMMKKLKLFIPQSEKEQTAIANVLGMVDKEIDLLEEELLQLKQQKKGLMQLLLTGKVRVKV